MGWQKPARRCYGGKDESSHGPCNVPPLLAPSASRGGGLLGGE